MTVWGSQTPNWLTVWSLQTTKWLTVWGSPTTKWLTVWGSRTPNWLKIQRPKGEGVVEPWRPTPQIYDCVGLTDYKQVETAL